MNKESINKALLEQGLIPVGEISPKNCDEIKALILTAVLEKREINLIFDSSGGDVASALKTYDFLMSFKKKTPTGIVVGSCHSAALIVLAGCQKRLSLPHSTFLFHAIRSNYALKSTDVLEESISLIRQDVKESDESIYQVFKKTIGMTRKDFNYFNKRGEFNRFNLSADKMKKIGFIHEIIEELPFDL